MPNLPFLQVDAFTNQRLAGNPCAVVFGAGGLSESQMLAVAREFNLSETAFVGHSSHDHFSVRYFTPAEEIPFAGHPTLATAWALVETQRLKLDGTHTAIFLELPVGLIKVELLAIGDRLQQVVMTQKKPAFARLYPASRVMPIFGLTELDLLPGALIQTVSTGTPQLMIPLRSQEALRHAALDIPAYSRLRADGDFFSPHLFTLVENNPDYRTFARHFGVPPDTMEDPFTGSATGAMAAYLWHYGWLDQPKFTAAQGDWMLRPGRGTVELIGPSQNIQAVKVGGAAVVVMSGEIRLP